jgi:transcriptional regulator with XRE-family HTH domain
MENKITGENLRKLRKKRNITQTRLAVELGISQEAISGFENKGTSIRIEYLKKMAKFLNTTVDYILECTDNDAPFEERINSIVDEQQNELLNNYAQLNNYQRKDLIWYSEMIKKKDLK